MKVEFGLSEREARQQQKHRQSKKKWEASAGGTDGTNIVRSMTGFIVTHATHHCFYFTKHGDNHRRDSWIRLFFLLIFCIFFSIVFIFSTLARDMSLMKKH